VDSERFRGGRHAPGDVRSREGRSRIAGVLQDVAVHALLVPRRRSELLARERPPAEPSRQGSRTSCTISCAELATDLVAQVLSPDDNAAEVLAKVADWLAAWTKLLCVVDPIVVTVIAE
jgi:hypothetical protein